MRGVGALSSDAIPQNLWWLLLLLSLNDNRLFSFWLLLLFSSKGRDCSWILLSRLCVEVSSDVSSDFVLTVWKRKYYTYTRENIYNFSVFVTHSYPLVDVVMRIKFLIIQGAMTASASASVREPSLDWLVNGSRLWT